MDTPQPRAAGKQDKDHDKDIAPVDDEVRTVEDVEEHAQAVQEYMKRLLGDVATMSDDAKTVTPSSHASDDDPASQKKIASYSTQANAGDHTRPRDYRKPHDNQVVEEKPSTPRKPASRDFPSPVAAPEGRDLLSRMRHVANESASSSLAEYQSKMGQATICRVGISIVLLGASFLSFGYASAGQVMMYFLGVGCWLAAAWVSVPLLTQLKSS